MFLRIATRPWTWIKVIASSIALITNAIQLSEISEQSGVCPEKRLTKRGSSAEFILPYRWVVMAESVAFRAYEIRRHLDVV